MAQPEKDRESDSYSNDDDYDITETIPEKFKKVRRQSQLEKNEHRPRNLQQHSSNGGLTTNRSRSPRHWLHSSLPRMKELDTKTETIERNVYKIHVDNVEGSITG